MGALGASVATHVTDACQVLVEQAAATGVDHKSALAKDEKVQGNTQRALDQEDQEEVEAMREALREAQEGRQKAEVEAAQLRVEVEGQRRRGDDLRQRLGVAEAQVVCVGSFTGGEFWVESGGLLNPSLREKKRHTRVCKGRAVEVWACTATPQAPVLFHTRALHAHCHGRASDGA